MVEIIKVYEQSMPATRFVGIKYGETTGDYGIKWHEWFSNNRFAALEALTHDGFFEDSGAYIGLMRWKDGEPFQYWIGMFLPAEAVVPQGYEHVDFPASKLGVAWSYGNESELFGNEELSVEAVKARGMEVTTGSDGGWWFFERYACPRFTEVDEQGKKILDICHFIK
ncbi:MAG: hypothetical protein FWC95_05160 [Defluviitaleaceae bacterium]|nr:hypothetical protein [Defluviitaleaceae bacterium]